LGAQGNAFAGVNLSDREDGWEYNYRVPDVAVFLSGTKAVDCRTHWRGPADLLVEITSPGDRVRDKLPFYSRLGVRELLVLTRKPWKLHFFQRHEGKLKRTQEATLDSPAAIVATVLPLTFRLVGAVPRPKIEVAHTVSTQKWLV
jgi:Uma2 family endonuclease